MVRERNVTTDERNVTMDVTESIWEIIITFLIHVYEKIQAGYIGYGIPDPQKWSVYFT